jgi:enoyl-CoA hydratase
MTAALETIRYEHVCAGVARIVLARPDVRNAQSRRMTYELNDAFDRAAAADDVKVIILAADGPDFCSGHDLRDMSFSDPVTPVGTSVGFGRPGAEGWMAFEEETYLGMCLRWREIPKPTIAAVQGRVLAGGLLLMWVCDLIIAAEGAVFCDSTVALGVNGVELFAHPWEVGARKAKELLFTGGWLDAHEAHRIGMVNRVVPANELQAATQELAVDIAARPSFALKLAKESVNQAVDAQGFRTAVHAAFGLHQLAHSHNQEQYGLPIDPGGLRSSRVFRDKGAEV